MSDEENSLYESPRDFWMPTSKIEGDYCDGQSVLPEGDGFLVSCTCGNFATEAPTTEAGLELARRHTSRVASSV